MEIQGKVKMIGDTQTIGASNFRKRELVITTEEQYPQHILIEFLQDKTQLLDTLRLGQEVKVSINFRGREWINPQGEAKYFNQIQGWKIESVGNVQKGPFETIPNEDLNDDDSDLPF